MSRRERDYSSLSITHSLSLVIGARVKNSRHVCGANGRKDVEKKLLIIQPVA